MLHLFPFSSANSPVPSRPAKGGWRIPAALPVAAASVVSAVQSVPPGTSAAQLTAGSPAVASIAIASLAATAAFFVSKLLQIACMRTLSIVRG